MLGAIVVYKGENMQWSADNTTPAIQSKSLELRELFAKVANASLDKGFSKEESIFAGMGAVKIHERKNAPVKAKTPKTPSHVESLRSYSNPFEVVSKVAEPKDFVKSAVLGKSALPSNQERTLVNADFNPMNQLVLTFDTGEKIVTSSPNIEQKIEQYLNITSSNGSASGSGLTNPVNYIEFNQDANLVADVGQLTWNDVDGTLDLSLKGGNVTLQIGQEQVVRFVNHTDLDFTELQVVRILGAQGNRLSASLAQADSESNSSTAFAIVTESILKNQQGYATTNGLVRNVNTSNFSEGSVLYLSPFIAGGITDILPDAPNRVVRVGYCVRSHAIIGSIFVNIIHDIELNDLPDVKIESPAEGDVLFYNSTSNLWQNKKGVTMEDIICFNLLFNE